MNVLVAVDGSPLSLKAVAHALAWMAAGLRAQLVLVNVQEPATVYEMVTLHDPQALAQLAQDAGRDMLAPAVALVTQAGFSCVQEVLTGDPVPMLLEALEEHTCQAIVMGSYGKGAVSSAWLGSVSREMLEKSPVPVTFVKPVVVS
jgi:nucleotide-binding universal stress UspA family protein